ASPHRPLDRAPYLPELDAALGAPAGGGQRGPVRDRGLAQLRRRLRPDPAGLARQRRSRVGAAAGALRRALPAHVALLPGLLDGGLQDAADPAVAGADVAAGRARRHRRAALSGAVGRVPLSLTWEKNLFCGSGCSTKDFPRRSGGSLLASVLLDGSGRRGAVLGGGIQATLHQQRRDIRRLAREVGEQLQRVLAAALRQQRGAETVAVGAG